MKSAEKTARESFSFAVFSRDEGRCVMCGAPAVDAHHVLDRKLFPDGGYHVENGASVCADCHLLAERTRISVEDIRSAAGITNPTLPPGFHPELIYDKWGNEIRRDGTRRWGPLRSDDGARRALSDGGLLWSGVFPWQT